MIKHSDPDVQQAANEAAASLLYYARKHGVQLEDFVPEDINNLDDAFEDGGEIRCVHFVDILAEYAIQFGALESEAFYDALDEAMEVACQIVRDAALVRHKLFYAATKKVAAALLAWNDHIDLSGLVCLERFDALDCMARDEVNSLAQEYLCEVAEVDTVKHEHQKALLLEAAIAQFQEMLKESVTSCTSRYRVAKAVAAMLYTESQVAMINLADECPSINPMDNEWVFDCGDFPKATEYVHEWALRYGYEHSRAYKRAWQDLASLVWEIYAEEFAA